MNTHETNDAQVKPDGAAIAPFRREERYLVFKRKDCEACMTTAEREQLIELARKMWAYRKDAGKSDFDCVVVESDWPEYEPAWAAIETRMTGRALTAAEKPEAVELGTFTGQIEKCESHPAPVLTGETPETDSLAYDEPSGRVVPYDFARQLERQRDEVRRELAKAQLPRLTE